MTVSLSPFPSPTLFPLPFYLSIYYFFFSLIFQFLLILFTGERGCVWKQKSAPVIWRGHVYRDIEFTEWSSSSWFGSTPLVCCINKLTTLAFKISTRGITPRAKITISVIRKSRNCVAWAWRGLAWPGLAWRRPTPLLGLIALPGPPMVPVLVAVPTYCATPCVGVSIRGLNLFGIFGSLLRLFGERN